MTKYNDPQIEYVCMIFNIELWRESTVANLRKNEHWKCLRRIDSKHFVWFNHFSSTNDTVTRIMISVLCQAIITKPNHQNRAISIQNCNSWASFSHVLHICHKNWITLHVLWHAFLPISCAFFPDLGFKTTRRPSISYTFSCSWPSFTSFFIVLKWLWYRPCIEILSTIFSNS